MLKAGKYAGRISDWLTGLAGRFHLSENTVMIMMAVVIGLLAGFGNFAFRKSIDFFHWLVFEQGLEFFVISLNEWSPSRFWTILFPAIGGILLIPFGIWFKQEKKFLVKGDFKDETNNRFSSNGKNN